MKIRILGCHGSDLLVEKDEGLHACRSVGVLINDTLMIDAGTAASALTIEEQQHVQCVLLSHFHIDHLKELPSLADNLLSQQGTAPLVVASIEEVLKGARTHIFNEQIFPDFFCLPTEERPTLQQCVLKLEQETWIAGLGITPVSVNHVVPTAGFIIRDQHSAFVFSGDTYQTDVIWSIAAKVSNLRAAFIETSFPNEMRDLAKMSKHLTPELLLQEFKKLGKLELPLYVYHLKPGLRDGIVSQLEQMGMPNLTILEEGMEIHL